MFVYLKSRISYKKSIFDFLLSKIFFYGNIYFSMENNMNFMITFSNIVCIIYRFLMLVVV